MVRSKKKKLVVFALLTLILIALIFENIVLRNSILVKDLLKQPLKLNGIASGGSDGNSGVVIFDLKAPLIPVDIYDSIACHKSSKYFVQTLLCVYSTEHDLISEAIVKRGIWDANVMSEFTRSVDKCGVDCIVLDIGADIGQYTLFAAKMGRNVIATEPFYDNLVRIHKAVKNEKLESKITLLKNLVSNKRNEIYELNPQSKSIGARHVKVGNSTSQKISGNYAVGTIFLDDLIPHLPAKAKKAIAKMDLEDVEIGAFERAKFLFDTLHISAIYMRWQNYRNEYSRIVIEMIDFLLNKGMLPLDIETNGQLGVKDWHNWPTMVVWKRPTEL